MFQRACLLQTAASDSTLTRACVEKHTHPCSDVSPTLREVNDGSFVPEPMARAPTRVRNSSLAQPIASADPAAVAALN